MPQFESRVTLPSDLDEFTSSYLETAEWADISDSCDVECSLCREDSRGKYMPCETEDCDCACHTSDADRVRDASEVLWSDAALAKAKKDCAAFQRDNAADIGGEHGAAGHDFWLTRNGHGAGFWDGDWTKDVGERLTRASKVFGEVNAFVEVSDGGETATLELT